MTDRPQTQRQRRHCRGDQPAPDFGESGPWCRRGERDLHGEEADERCGEDRRHLPATDSTSEKSDLLLEETPERHVARRRPPLILDHRPANAVVGHPEQQHARSLPTLIQYDPVHRYFMAEHDLADRG